MNVTILKGGCEVTMDTVSWNLEITAISMAEVQDVYILITVYEIIGTRRNSSSFEKI